MVWVRLDDHFDEHPKVACLGDGAFRAHVEALCYSNRALLDGMISAGVARVRGWTRRTRELVSAGLWDEVDGGWRMHGYAEYQSTRRQQVVCEGKRSRPLFKLESLRDPGRQKWNAMRHMITPQLMARDGAYCAHCGEERDLTIDHVRPLSRGGSNELSNLQVLCRPCNSRKGARADGD